jgi:hypothetical protein
MIARRKLETFVDACLGLIDQPVDLGSRGPVFDPFYGSSVYP